jgi:hypothetical protein
MSSNKPFKIMQTPQQDLQVGLMEPGDLVIIRE